MKHFKERLVHLDLEAPHDGAALRCASAGRWLSRFRQIKIVRTEPPTALLPGLADESLARVARWLPQGRAEVQALIHRHFRGSRSCPARVRVPGGADCREVLKLLLDDERS